LTKELHISRFDTLDATNYSASTGSRKRSDTSERMKQAHEAAAHDKWFREQVELAITEADNPATQWVSDEDAKAGWAKKRAELAKQAKGSAA
jgi:hypothetical protein